MRQRDRNYTTRSTRSAIRMLRSNRRNCFPRVLTMKSAWWSTPLTEDSLGCLLPSSVRIRAEETAMQP